MSERTPEVDEEAERLSRLAEAERKLEEAQEAIALAGAGHRTEVRDHQLTRLDASEVKARMQEAQDAFVDLGVAVYLIAIKRRRGVEYSLELHRDGARDVPVRSLQAIADEFNLDLAFSGDTILVDARPKPNW